MKKEQKMLIRNLSLSVIVIIMFSILLWSSIESYLSPIPEYEKCFNACDQLRFISNGEQLKTSGRWENRKCYCDILKPYRDIELNMSGIQWWETTYIEETDSEMECKVR